MRKHARWETLFEVLCVRPAKRRRPGDIPCLVKQKFPLSRCSRNSLTRTFPTESRIFYNLIQMVSDDSMQIKLSTTRLEFNLFMLLRTLRIIRCRLHTVFLHIYVGSCVRICFHSYSGRGITLTYPPIDILTNENDKRISSK